MVLYACRSTALPFTALLMGAVGLPVSALAQPCEPNWEGRALVPGPNHGVGAMTVYDDGRGPALYAGGLFTGAGRVKLNRIARWDGQEWFPLGGGVDARVMDLIVFDDGSGPALYATGDFTEAGGTPAGRSPNGMGTAGPRWDSE